jgi:hypothetical protein
MYFHKHLIDLVRLIGYDGLPLDDFYARLQPLKESHGEDAIRDACAEIVQVDVARTPLCARLTEHARTLAVGILGRPDRAEPQVSPAAAPETNTPSTAAASGSYPPHAPAGPPSQERQPDRKKVTPAAEEAAAPSKPTPHRAKPKASKASKKVPPATKPTPKKPR